MSLKAQAVKNVSATWLGLAVHAVVGFFLSPFILHRLGDEAFSLWVLVFSLTGYYGLLDLGIRSSIVKYTAKFVATNDEHQLSAFLSTSLGFFAVVGFVVLLMTVTGFFYLHLLFRIPAGMLGSARGLFLLAGVSVALTFPLGVFAGFREPEMRPRVLPRTKDSREKTTPSARTIVNIPSHVREAEASSPLLLWARGFCEVLTI
jgi:O-antigen/teichoic acid export membrane protein